MQNIRLVEYVHLWTSSLEYTRTDEKHIIFGKNVGAPFMWFYFELHHIIHIRIPPPFLF